MAINREDFLNNPLFQDWFAFEDKQIKGPFRVDINEYDTFFNNLVKTNFQVPIHETLLLSNDVSRNETNSLGLVITEESIYCIPSPNNYFYVNWADIHHVEYRVDIDSVIFIDFNNNIIASIPTALFLPVEAQHSLISKISLGLNYLLGRFNFLLPEQEEKYDAALQSIYAMSPGEQAQPMIQLAAGRIMLKTAMGNFEGVDGPLHDKIMGHLSAAMTSRELRGECYYWAGYCELLAGNQLEARSQFIAAIAADNDKDRRNDALSQLTELDEEIKGAITELNTAIPPEQRKIIYCVDDYQNAPGYREGVFVVTPQLMPLEPGAILVLVPSDEYVNIKELPDYKIKNQCIELINLLCALGATKIQISIPTGGIEHFKFSDDDLFKERKPTSIHINEVVLNDTTVDQLVAYFDAVEEPHVPDNCLWLSSQLSWNELVNRRLQAGLMANKDFETTIDGCADDLVDSRLVNALKYGATQTPPPPLPYKYFVTVKASFTASVAQLAELSAGEVSNSGTLFSAQGSGDAYRNVIAPFFGNGEFTAREREMLDTMAVIMGVDLSEAHTIQQQLSGELSKTEKAYRLYYQECKEGGDLSPVDRQRLDRLARNLGIAPSRKNFLES